MDQLDALLAQRPNAANDPPQRGNPASPATHGERLAQYVRRRWGDQVAVLTERPTADLRNGPAVWLSKSQPGEYAAFVPGIGFCLASNLATLDAFLIRHVGDRGADRPEGGWLHE
jgi:hypothetical protein